MHRKKQRLRSQLPLSVLGTILLLLLGGAEVRAQAPAPEQQIEAAVQAAPEALREQATVRGYTAVGEFVTLRRGEGALICLADDPSDDRFHVSCYHRSLAPFMQSGRELRAQGYERSEVDSLRRVQIESGAWAMPERPAALYSLTGPADGYDYETGTLREARPLHVLYVPGATAASTGLPQRGATGTPWLMEGGTPWAHVMVVQPPRGTAADSTGGDSTGGDSTGGN